MIELNDTNGASSITAKYYKKVLTEFAHGLTGAEFGVAYGGGIERIGQAWKDRGIIYGFDTFEGHPKEIGDLCPYSAEAGGKDSFAATCMDNWYKPENFGADKITYEYIRSELDKKNLSHVKLVKGLVTSKTDVSFISELHYCLLDLDFPLSMSDAYYLVRDKIVRGGYLLLHDVIPKGHIYGCWEVYQSILKEGMFDIVEENESALLVVLRKK